MQDKIFKSKILSTPTKLNSVNSLKIKVFRFLFCFKFIYCNISVYQKRSTKWLTALSE